jgi:hypothetical protein
MCAMYPSNETGVTLPLKTARHCPNQAHCPYAETGGHDQRDHRDPTSHGVARDLGWPVTKSEEMGQRDEPEQGT